VHFDVTGKLLMRFFAFVRCWNRNESTVRQYIDIHRRQESPSYFKNGSIVQCSH
jgi:hypothetical protein